MKNALATCPKCANDPVLPGPGLLGSVCLWASWERGGVPYTLRLGSAQPFKAPEPYYTVHLHTHLSADTRPTGRKWGGLGATSSSLKEVWGTLASPNLPDGTFFLGCSRCGLLKTPSRNRTFHICLCLRIHPSSPPTPRKPCAWTTKASEVPTWHRNYILDIRKKGRRHSVVSWNF